MFNVFDLKLGQLATNCYIVSNEQTKEAIIFDPADEVDKIIEFLNRKEIDLKAIFLTHGHSDHILATNELKNKYNIKIYASLEEKDFLKNTDANLTEMFGNPYTVDIDECLSDNQEINIIGTIIKCIHTPGHTQGSMSYYIASEGLLFSGDTLFVGSVGRTDFPTGNHSKLMDSIINKLMKLPNRTIIYTGHGDNTTIQEEKYNNPYICGYADWN